MNITQYNDYDYIEPTKEQIKQVMDVISRIYRENEALKFSLHNLGRMMSGRAIRDCNLIVYYGEGSRGKSFIYELLSNTLKPYYQLLTSDCFSTKKGNVDKILNSFKSHYRYYVINETTGKTLRTDSLKQLCDGRIKATKLYEDGVYDIDVYGTLNFISNEMLTFPPDSGINRRLVGYEYKNKFITNDNEIPDNKTSFKADETLKI